jgi:hypothetical protein
VPGEGWLRVRGAVTRGQASLTTHSGNLKCVPHETGAAGEKTNVRAPVLGHGRGSLGIRAVL